MHKPYLCGCADTGSVCSVAFNCLFFKCKHPFTSIVDAWVRRGHGVELIPMSSPTATTDTRGLAYNRSSPNQSGERKKLLSPSTSSSVSSERSFSPQSPLSLVVRQGSMDIAPQMTSQARPTQSACSYLPSGPQSVQNWLHHSEAVVRVPSSSIGIPLYTPNQKLTPSARKPSTSTTASSSARSHLQTSVRSFTPAPTSSRLSAASPLQVSSTPQKKYHLPLDIPEVPPIPEQYLTPCPARRGSRSGNFPPSIGKSLREQQIQSQAPSYVLGVEVRQPPPWPRTEPAMPPPAFFAYAAGQERVQRGKPCQ